ncbi:hypothetical protein TREMEDRAFT_44918 [Tremella mesenterica DSM 1558]|uniref:uncharacterized protein n=1 Tax=Tremella mesenterica (strain ATCC 24925 / CBS 8224 / DSM 1558 / NBRC 9311 / NRRL Y-6157 / RJB 2259-6 / UBC 559-6) TaxID=578456 RepID=UPI0003F49408|nr:uncharacterized protein TREMEDRAFT_44918 [Tremella mesenterica DSM 1558]EIW67903.1 hypothetical protein TREMEDRAFT_44918 [Tremella mesenterica DSM 1558]
MALPGTETLRFRRPTTGPNAIKPNKDKAGKDKDTFGTLGQAWKRRHGGLLQDQVGRQSNGPFIPSMSFAVRLLLLMRTTGAMYNVIADCDEVFNFFEPLHYFQYNSGFQTWELSPEFAIRSWAYVLLHWPLAYIGPKVLGLGKRQAFFALRIFLGAISSYCEARFFRAVVHTVNERVGRYLLFMMMLSAGMWGASVSFLPSSFTMYTTMLAAAEWLHPSTSTPEGIKHAYRGTFFVAVGAIVGWPFSAVLGIPFVFEYLFLTGGDAVVGKERSDLYKKRWMTMSKAVIGAACVAIPIYLIDSWAYGRQTFPTFNILIYNLFPSLSSSKIGGPDLYGTSPIHFYFLNLLLNFNFLFPLSLLSLPLLCLTWKYDYRRLGKSQMRPKPGETSPYTLLFMRLLPFYLWFTILSLTPHKEERFLFPSYPLLCFNASVSLYLLRGLIEGLFIKLTNSPYRASRSNIFPTFTLLVVIFTGLISIGRLVGMFKWYHAPLDLAYHFEYNTIPSLLSSLGYTPKPPPKDFKQREGEVIVPEWDYTPLEELDEKITMCWAGEWFRFPGSHLFPEGIDVKWVKTEFDGMMPRKWEPSGENKVGWWPREETRVVRPGRFNGQNKASLEVGTYFAVENCTYLVDLSLPSKPITELEPDYTSDERFIREWCTTFLDGPSSRWWARLIWLPWDLGDEGRVYGKYCLLRRK